MFLALEGPDTPQNIGFLAIFEGAPLVGPDGRFRIDHVVDFVRGTVHGFAPFRHRILPVPFGLGRPVWIDHAEFDVANHVRAETLAAPTRAALLARAGEFFAEPLDLDLPLWDILFLDGLPDGHVALLSKTHHAAIDGASAMAGFRTMASFDPEPRPVVPPQPWTPAPVPSKAALVAGALAHQVRHAGKLARLAGRAIVAPRRAVDRARRAARAAAPFLRDRAPVPPLSINRRVGPRRRLATVALSLDDAKRIRAVLGGTVNDVLVAAVAGGLRHLLHERGELAPGVAATVMCPVSTREEGQIEAGNQVGALTVTVPLDLDDPVARFHEVTAATQRAKTDDPAADLDFVAGLFDFMVPAMQRRAARSVHEQQGYNLTVSNLAGVPIPMWFQGARLLELYPVVPVGGYVGVNVVGLSNCGRLFVSLTADADANPDLDVFALGIEAAFGELLVAASP